MPRQARIDIPGALHHIMVRVINRSPIFLNDQDRQRFLDRLGSGVTEGEYGLYGLERIGREKRFCPSQIQQGRHSMIKIRGLIKIDFYHFINYNKIEN